MPSGVYERKRSLECKPGRWRDADKFTCVKCHTEKRAQDFADAGRGSRWRRDVCRECRAPEISANRSAANLARGREKMRAGLGKRARKPRAEKHALLAKTWGNIIPTSRVNTIAKCLRCERRGKIVTTLVGHPCPECGAT